jgi:hypothetical protein
MCAARISPLCIAWCAGLTAGEFSFLSLLCHDSRWAVGCNRIHVKGKFGHTELQWSSAKSQEWWLAQGAVFHVHHLSTTTWG